MDSNPGVFHLAVVESVGPVSWAPALRLQTRSPSQLPSLSRLSDLWPLSLKEGKGAGTSHTGASWMHLAASIGA